MNEDGAVCWLHLGDTHLVGRGEANYAHLRALADEARAKFSDVDFVYMPGDVAEHGEPGEYDLAQDALARLRLPVFAIPGDHDMHPGHTENFQQFSRLRLPHFARFGARRCLFLDLVSEGEGGPDFRLGAAQRDWLRRELEVADGEGGALLFMHAYPADLVDPDERRELVDLIRRHRVLSVDMGHTHYNELSNDGRTLFAATRSIGQMEEGPPGVSLMAVDASGSASWRFKPLADSGPFALILSPCDRRLATAFSPLVRPGERLPVRALAFPAQDVVSCRFQIDDGPWFKMERSGGRSWSGETHSPHGGFRLTVEARLAAGEVDRDVVEVEPAAHFDPPAAAGDGSDADAVGAWPERHIHGGQLGPNRNGRQW